MSLRTRLVLVVATLALLAAAWPESLLAQRARRGPPMRPPDRGAVVFIGGYFYDPFFGPYPWWGRGAYPYPYYPVYDNRAIARIIATPKDAAVYVDGFYAGTVHDFNDWFQGLPLPPGGHELVIYLVGYRTIRHSLYFAPGSTHKIQTTMDRLPAGEQSEPPTLAPPVPPPPDGSYLPPPRRPNPS